MRPFASAGAFKLKWKTNMQVCHRGAYSCNNSSDIGLVACFQRVQQARDMTDELRSFFEDHAKEQEEKRAAGSASGPTQVAIAFGKKYNHDWQSFLTWGEEGMIGEKEDDIRFQCSAEKCEFLLQSRI